MRAGFYYLLFAVLLAGKPIAPSRIVKFAIGCLIRRRINFAFRTTSMSRDRVKNMCTASCEREA